MKTLRAVIVGAGLMGRWHALYARKAGAVVAAIVDPNSSRAADLQKKCPRARVFTDLADCFAFCPTDVVHICTPVGSHERLAEIALQAGQPVLVEKPLSASLRATERLIRLARSKNVPLNPVHQFPFQRGFRRLWQRREELGDLVRVSFNLCSAGGTGRTHAGCRELLLEILPHPFSVLLSLYGRGVADCSWSILRFTSSELEMSGSLHDALLEIRLSLRGRPPRNELTIVGTKKTGYVDLFHGYSFLESGGVSRTSKVLRPLRFGSSLLAAAGANLLQRALRREFAYPGLAELIRSFYESIHEGRAAPIGEEEILEITNLIDRISCFGRGNRLLHDGVLPDANTVPVSAE
jgi:predicted dehydrogenase